MSSSIGEWLEMICGQRGLSWRTASLQAGLNPGAIRYFIRNPDAVPSPDTCKKLAAFFHVDVSFMHELAGYRDEPASASEDPQIGVYLRQISSLPEEDLLLLLEMVRPFIERATKSTREGVSPPDSNLGRSVGAGLNSDTRTIS